jgi:integrase
VRGNITKRGQNSWQLKFDAPPGPDGKRRQRYATVRGTYKDAQKELTRLLRAADDGALPDPTRQTIGEYIQAYLDSALDLSPKTLERYRELAGRQIVPHLGGYRLTALKAEHVGQWHAALLGEGLSPRTIVHAHRLLSSVLERAIENGTLNRNVASIRKPPKVEDQEIEILSVEEIATVMDALYGHALYPIASLALATGMRRGEVLALEWSDIDLDAASIRNRACCRGNPRRFAYQVA